MPFSESAVVCGRLPWANGKNFLQTFRSVASSVNIRTLNLKKNLLYRGLAVTALSLATYTASPVLRTFLTMTLTKPSISKDPVYRNPNLKYMYINPTTNDLKKASNPRKSLYLKVYAVFDTLHLHVTPNVDTDDLRNVSNPQEYLLKNVSLNSTNIQRNDSTNEYVNKFNPLLNLLHKPLISNVNSKIETRRRSRKYKDYKPPVTSLGVTFRHVSSIVFQLLSCSNHVEKKPRPAA